MKKFFITLIVLAIIGGGAYFGYNYYKDSQIESISTFAFQTEYIVGDSLNLDGAKIVVNYKNRDSEQVDLKLSHIKNEFNSATEGTRQLTINYKNQQITVNYTVLRITKIAVNGVATEYQVGDAVEVKNATLLVTYSNGNTATKSLSASDISNLSTTQIGQREFKVTYKKQTTSVTYKVYPKFGVYNYSKAEYKDATTKAVLKTEYLEVGAINEQMRIEKALFGIESLKGEGGGCDYEFEFTTTTASLQLTSSDIHLDLETVGSGSLDVLNITFASDGLSFSYSIPKNVEINGVSKACIVVYTLSYNETAQ